MALSDDIKERLDIVDVVSSYVDLRKAGRSYRARCPFHVERTPSFFVFPERQTWRCFGACATGGDIFSFVMRAENRSFSEALRLLAERAGVALSPQRRSEQDDPLYHLNQEAARLFQEALASQQGAEARAYLDKRRVGADAVRQFALGFSPPGGEALKRHLLSLGFAEEQLASAGLIIGGTNEPAHDMFRGRLMFPIRNERGQVTGFGGRALGNAPPKYINTPRSPVFDKGHLLYGLDLAKEAIRQQNQAVVVEGYMDVIAAHEHGYTNVVASMGTALTDAQVGLLRKLARTFVLALDPDTAGQEATLRSLESSWRVFEQRVAAQGRRGVTLYERGRQAGSLKIAVLPEGKDPDELIRDEPERWQNITAEAMPLLDYLFARMASQFDLSSSTGKAAAAQRLFPLIAAMDNPFEQDRYFRQLARLLDVSETTLEASMGRPQRRPASRRSTPPEAATSPFARSQAAPLEEHTMALLLRYPELTEPAQGLREDHFQWPENRALFMAWRKYAKLELIGTEEDALRRHLEHLLAREIPPASQGERATDLSTCIRRLEERRLRDLKMQEEVLLAQAADDADGELQEALQQQVISTNEQLRQLFAKESP